MKYANLDKLDRLCKGDENKRKKYLDQYLELIPSSVIRIEIAIKQLDRKVLAQEIHRIKPQLVFFGMKDFSLANIQDKTEENLIPWVNNLLVLIKKSILEIENALQDNEGS